MMPAVPDPESPSGADAPPAAGSASAAHWRGSDVHPGFSPHDLAGETSPWMSVTSKPGGNSPRMRTMLDGVTEIGWLSRDGTGGVDCTPCGDDEHAATASAASRVNPRIRTPVDITGPILSLRRERTNPEKRCIW